MTEQPIKRNRYFDPPNMECDLIGETYDQDIQNFHLRSAQTQLASLHNWGIVQGLEVSGTLGSSAISINGGVAVDAQGRLIVLATEGRGDLGNNPPGNNHDLVPVPVEFNTSSFAATSYYLTIQFSEYKNYNDPDSDTCGRLEQAPWLRLQPVSGFTDDGTSVVLAVVTLDSSGNIVALGHQDSSLSVTRHLSGKTVGQLQIRRSQTVGNAIAETNAGKLEALASGGLQLSVTNSSDRILLNQADGSNFSSLTVNADLLDIKGELNTKGSRGVLRLRGGEILDSGSEARIRIIDQGDLHLRNGQGDTSLTIRTDGNVGIGKPNPREKLEVSGRLRISEGSQLTFGGHLYLSKQDGLPGRGQWHVNVAPNNALNFVESGIADYRLVIKHGGNVGIGTNDPIIKLDVRGGWIGSGDNSQTVGGWRLGRWPASSPNTWVYLSRTDTSSNEQRTYQDLAVGALWAAGDQRFGSASDLAEMTPVKSEDNLEPGDVVVIAEPEDDRVLLAKSNKGYDSKVAGVVSDTKSAGLVIGGCHTEDITRNYIKPIALAGRFLTKVTLENGSIKAGEFLTTSSTPGHAMKASQSGYVIGKALQSFSGGSSGESTGKIWILVNLSWFDSKH